MYIDLRLYAFNSSNLHLPTYQMRLQYCFVYLFVSPRENECLQHILILILSVFPQHTHTLSLIYQFNLPLPCFDLSFFLFLARTAVGPFSIPIPFHSIPSPSRRSQISQSGFDRVIYEHGLQTFHRISATFLALSASISRTTAQEPKRIRKT